MVVVCQVKSSFIYTINCSLKQSQKTAINVLHISFLLSHLLTLYMLYSVYLNSIVVQHISVPVGIENLVAPSNFLLLHMEFMHRSF